MSPLTGSEYDLRELLEEALSLYKGAYEGGPRGLARLYKA